MILRRDLRKDGTQARKDLQGVLTRMGGVNVYGEPLFRLIRAEDRITQAAGAWAIWPDDVAVEDRGGLALQTAQQMCKEGRELLERMYALGGSLEDIRKQARENTNIVNEFLNSRMDAAPVRVEFGVSEVPLYPYEGWVIEKWKPAHTFGAPNEWEAYRFGGECAIGPYPHHGDYELVAGPTPYMPTAKELEDAVRQQLKETEAKPFNPAQRVFRMVERQEQMREKRQKNRKGLILDYLQDSPASLYKTVSLGAGRVREQMAKRAGLKGHYGN
jgi:hypothetical protein